MHALPAIGFWFGEASLEDVRSDLASGLADRIDDLFDAIEAFFVVLVAPLAWLIEEREEILAFVAWCNA